jgi:hypothetical protein
VHVVGHDSITVKTVMAKAMVVVADGFNHHAGYLGPAKVQRAGGSRVEQSVHRQEGFAGSVGGREGAIRWEAAREAPGDEHGAVDRVVVGQATDMEGGHAK